MCGIVGFTLRKICESPFEELIAATNSLKHRGPDASGIYLDRNAAVGLGHTRLSIIDLSHVARQPMGSEDNRIWIVYNGEIYNFLTLRNLLISKGFNFKSRSDTEVILNSYIYWGEDCIKYLEGMFAFAIWDKAQNKLFLARDRMGKKPLYYYWDGKNLYFASELKALSHFKEVKKDIDLNSLALYLHYQYIPAPRTIYRQVFKLEPAHSLTISDKGLTLKRYYSPPEWTLGDTNFTDIKSAIQGLKDILSQAVKDRLISDVPLGCLLSGGVDSSLITALAQNFVSPIKTFTISFKEKSYDEGPYAQEVSKILGTDHTELSLSADEALQIIPNFPYIYDEPFGDSSGLPTYLVSKLASTKVKVVLTGDGGDEQFGGYVRYWATESLIKLQRFLRPLLKPLNILSKSLPQKTFTLMYEAIKNYLPQRYQVTNVNDKLQKLLSTLTEGDLQSIYRLSVAIFSKDMVHELIKREITPSSFEHTFEATKDLPTMARLMLVDQKTYLPECMLTKVDRASMANGLEVRCPLLDTRVLEFSRKLPLNFLFSNGTGKRILKLLLKEFLPERLIYRPKAGFGVPLDSWFRRELKQMLLDYLSTERLKKEGLFNPTTVSKLLDQHLKGTSNHQHRLWVLLVWQLWRDTWCKA